VNLAKKDGTVYMHDVYAGPGLAGVPRGTVKRLRVHAYHFGYRGLSGWDKIGIDGPWEVMRILGTVPVADDGSAMFKAPANTPLAVQPLDAEGRAVQVMRSWFTVMPGEVRSCVGCHETQNTLPAVRTTAAATSEPAEIMEFHGPARGFDFERDLQRPVLDKYCAGCHDGRAGRPDLRNEDHFPDYKGKLTSVPKWWRDVPAVYDAELMRQRTRTGAPIKMTATYEVLHPYARRYGLEGDYVMSNTAEYHASTSELVQMLEKGHHGVEMDREAWERIYTWIDLNVPCHGTWSDALAIPFKGRQRRLELASLYAGGMTDPEEVPLRLSVNVKPVMPGVAEQKCEPVTLPGWPFDLAEARARQQAAGEPIEKIINLGGGEKLRLVLIPAGEYVMGAPEGTPDEQPLHRVRIEKPFWMAATEISNAQYARFDCGHDSKYINVIHTNTEERGFPVNRPEQPAVRMTWTQAVEFSEWLSERTGLRFSLPSEEQWEWAVRAGTGTPFHYGFARTNFDRWANLADRSMKGFYDEALDRVNNRSLRRDLVDWMLRVPEVNDKHQVSAPVGTYRPNAWGLRDMHGNVAEWTSSEYAHYADGAAIGTAGRMVVRGGSWNDRPHRARSGFRWAYSKWQPVYNVGIRVVAEVE
jgi:formylglycine-generating enzyme required for sulfatase activity